MKTLFFLITCFLFSIVSFSQVVIEQTDLLQPGDTFLIHVDLSPEVLVDLTPGTDLEWDFTGLNNDQTNFACYPPSDDLEFIDEFPLSGTYTYGPGFLYAGPGGTAPMDNWGYLMTFTNSNGLFSEGFYSDYGMGYRSTYNTPSEMLMFTPAQFMDQQSPYSYWEVNINLSDETPIDIDTLYRRGVNKVLDADAWGSIITEYGTFDVLRIHETGISIDSAFGVWNSTVMVSLEVSRDTINNYYFWAKEIRNPVLTLHCDFDGNIERIDYMMGAIYSSKNLIQSHPAKVFPNPASDKINLASINGEIMVFNVAGELVMQTYVTDTNTILDISSLKDGLYLIKDIKGNSTKFIKQ
jgi:hypothetical protein